MGMPVPINCFATEERNVNAYTNSWVTSVTVKITTVRIPDVEIGITILTKAPKRVRPSTMAASSSSLGIDLKKPIRSQTENGMVMLGYTSTRDQMVSCSPRLATTRDN